MTIEDYYRPVIAEALRQLVTNPDEIAKHAVEVASHYNKAADPDKKAIARNAVDHTAKTDPEALVKALKRLYGDAGMTGAKTALDDMGGAAKLGSGMSGLVGGVDWANWKPGNPEAAEKVAGKRLGEIWSNAGYTVDGITKTTTNRIGTIIADGLTAGSTWQEISAGINDLLNNPGRADIIAITETNRAFIGASVDEYQNSGMDGFTWLAYDGACPECEEQAGDHSFGDDYPPAHPACRCAVIAIIPDETLPLPSED